MNNNTNILEKLSDAAELLTGGEDSRNFQRVRYGRPRLTAIGETVDGLLKMLNALLRDAREIQAYFRTIRIRFVGSRETRDDWLQEITLMRPKEDESDTWLQGEFDFGFESHQFIACGKGDSTRNVSDLAEVCFAWIEDARVLEEVENELKQATEDGLSVIIGVNENCENFFDFSFLQKPYQVFKEATPGAAFSRAVQRIFFPHYLTCISLNRPTACVVRMPEEKILRGAGLPGSSKQRKKRTRNLTELLDY